MNFTLPSITSKKPRIEKRKKLLYSLKLIIFPRFLFSTYIHVIVLIKTHILIAIRDAWLSRSITQHRSLIYYKAISRSVIPYKSAMTADWCGLIIASEQRCSSHRQRDRFHRDRYYYHYHLSSWDCNKS